MKGHDLQHFVRHRQLDAYEYIVARRSYAYGVDLRRSSWLADSTIGNSVVRAVDRAWPLLAEHLLDEALLDSLATPTSLLHEVAMCVALLRAPVPAIRLVRASQRGRWPLVTVLGATRGSAQWLVLDAEALVALDPEVRAFLLGAGLGHVQCGHAVFFTAHLLTTRREGGSRARALKQALWPWTKVMTFSADRAGLLACGSLAAAISTIESPAVPVGEDPVPRWLPPLPSVAMRVQAIEEFARSAVFAQVDAERARFEALGRNLSFIASGEGVVQSSAAGEQDQAEVEAKAEPSDPMIDGWSLARVDARLTRRLKLL